MLWPLQAYLEKDAKEMKAKMEAESKARAELQRTRKKLEADVGELETAMEQANQVTQSSSARIHKQ